MMNIRLFTLVLVALLSLNAGASGQQNHVSKNKYIVLTKKIEQFKPIALTSAELADEDGASFGEFKAILYGPEVVQLTDRKKMKPILKMARQSNLKLAVCEMALDKWGVDHRKIPKAFEIVDNAFLHFPQLQKMGYFSLSL